MKKIILLICMAFLITGCTNINNLSYNELLQNFAKKTIRQNTYRTGYKYYLPQGMQVTDSTLYNEVIEDEEHTYYLNFIADIYKVSKEKKKELISKYSKDLDIYNELGNKISSFSHGMKQKIALIAALVHEPKVLILDEPFVGLDPISIHYLKNLLRDMSKRGVSILTYIENT